MREILEKSPPFAPTNEPEQARRTKERRWLRHRDDLTGAQDLRAVIASRETDRVVEKNFAELRRDEPAGAEVNAFGPAAT